MPVVFLPSQWEKNAVAGSRRQNSQADIANALPPQLSKQHHGWHNSLT